MLLNLEGLELTEDQVEKINSQNEGLKTEVEIEAQIAGLKANRDKLKAEQQQAKDSQAAAEAKIEEQRIAHLQENKNFKELAESYKLKLDEQEALNKQASERNNALAVKNKSIELAGLISEGHRAELLSKFIEKRLRMDSGEVKVTNLNGELTISSTDDLISEFKMDEKYASLISQTKATGGKGSGQGTVETLTIKSDDETGINVSALKENIKSRLAKLGVK